MLNPSATEFKPIPTETPNQSHQSTTAAKRNKPRRKNKSGPSTNNDTTTALKPETSRRKQKTPRRPSIEPTPPQVEQPATSFITIDHTIDPAIQQKNTLLHGYDHYLAWIERCLHMYPVITVVGMDPAMADVVSLVTLVQSKGIGSYHGNNELNDEKDEQS
ncbi:hypothetical protein [Absidia glauca]|uniref:Uncharacterized protein n=1 Tax=Absidia glauca TaxID=4829 RepID=A0A163MPC9_ABSGL|nr:hypothetical protein [Absidia glauca]